MWCHNLTNSRALFHIPQALSVLDQYWRLGFWLKQAEKVMAVGHVWPLARWHPERWFTVKAPLSFRSMCAQVCTCAFCYPGSLSETVNVIPYDSVVEFTSVMFFVCIFLYLKGNSVWLLVHYCIYGSANKFDSPVSKWYQERVLCKTETLSLWCPAFIGLWSSASSSPVVHLMFWGL